MLILISDIYSIKLNNQLPNRDGLVLINNDIVANVLRYAVNAWSSTGDNNVTFYANSGKDYIRLRKACDVLLGSNIECRLVDLTNENFITDDRDKYTYYILEPISENYSDAEVGAITLKTPRKLFEKDDIIVKDTDDGIEVYFDLVGFAQREIISQKMWIEF